MYGALPLLPARDLSLDPCFLFLLFHLPKQFLVLVNVKNKYTSNIFNLLRFDKIKNLVEIYFLSFICGCLFLLFIWGSAPLPARDSSLDPIFFIFFIHFYCEIGWWVLGLSHKIFSKFCFGRFARPWQFHCQGLSPTHHLYFLFCYFTLLPTTYAIDFTDLSHYPQ